MLLVWGWSPPMVLLMNGVFKISAKLSQYTCGLFRAHQCSMAHWLKTAALENPVELTLGFPELCVYSRLGKVFASSD